MFLTKKAFKLAMAARREDDDAHHTDRLLSLTATLRSRADAQEAAVKKLHAELRERDQVLAENTRRINALMAAVELTEVTVPATPEATIYIQGGRP